MRSPTPAAPAAREGWEQEWRDRIGAAEWRAERLEGQADFVARRLSPDMSIRSVTDDAQAGLARDVEFILRVLRAASAQVAMSEAGEPS